MTGIHVRNSFAIVLGLTLGLNLFSSPAYSEQSDTAVVLQLPLYFELGGSWGFAQASGATNSANPSLSQWTIDGVIAARLATNFLIGITSQYSFIGQTSNVNANVGSFSGSFF